MYYECIKSRNRIRSKRYQLPKVKKPLLLSNLRACQSDDIVHRVLIYMYTPRFVACRVVRDNRVPTSGV